MSPSTLPAADSLVFDLDGTLWDTCAACAVGWNRVLQRKAENLAALIARNGLSQPWFIGDTPGDLLAARTCDVPFVHAGYGFGLCDQAELRLREFTDLVGVLSAVDAGDDTDLA